MENTILMTVSEDVINSVVKPISMFLNDIEDDAVFTHLPQKSTGGYDIETTGKKKTFPTFRFASSKGGVYKFTLFDLRNFTLNGKPFASYFLPILGQQAYLQDTFVVNKVRPLLVNGEKSYPFFCYEGYDQYLLEKSELDDGQYATDKMVADLKATEIKELSVDRYYRTVDTDKPVFYYEPKK